MTPVPHKASNSAAKPTDPVMPMPVDGRKPHLDDLGPMPEENWIKAWTILGSGRRAQIMDQRNNPKEREPDPREQKLPGKPTARATVLREYEKRLAEAKERNPRDRWPVLFTAGYYELDEIYRWRVKLECGCIRDLVTAGDDKPPTDCTWKGWTDEESLNQGELLCMHNDTDPRWVFRTITEWSRRKEVDREGDPVDPPGWWGNASKDVWEILRMEPRRVAQWTVKLECGHTTNVDTDLEWQPSDGYRPTITSEQVAERRERVEKMIDEDVAERPLWEHQLRMINIGVPEPDPEHWCSTCPPAKRMIAYERVGWLVPPKRPVQDTPPKPRVPNRQQLEARIRELEGENARLRGGMVGDH
jgi:hypothetical protein